MESERSGIQVIARAAAVLRALDGEPAGLSLGQLAERIDLPRSTVQRIVGALAEEKLLVSGGRGGVTLGPALVRLAASVDVDVVRAARPIMQHLSRATGETVDLSVLQGRSAVFVDQVIGTARLVAVSAVGEAFPLHCTANGKALLACIPAAARRALLGGKLARLTDATTTDPVALLAEISAFAESQLSWDMEEHSEGMCAVGTAFIDPAGRDFAVSIPMPRSRFDAKREGLGAQLLDARDQMLRLLPGSRRPQP